MPPFSDRVCLSVTGSMAGCDIVGALRTSRRLGFVSVAAMPSGAPQHSLGRLLPTLGFDVAGPATREAVTAELRRFRRISIHQAWDDKWRFWFDTAAEVGAEIVTVHARLPTPASAEVIAARAAELTEWGRYAAERRIAVGVENEGMRECDFLSLVERLDGETVGVTLDIGHCAYFAEMPQGLTVPHRAAVLNERIQNLVRRLGRRLKLLHVHNVKPFEQVDFSRIPKPYWKPGMLVDHRRIDDGLIDVPALAAVLAESGYDGMFEIELEEPDLSTSARLTGAFLDRLVGVASGPANCG
ncbi:MAG: sugar phosphate isomerase/epimerase [Kiritimatiellaeota bacterium]|nr:sugar phosphate isomerase/epimerase [Kiritimatiellota bacterium]